MHFAGPEHVKDYDDKVQKLKHMGFDEVSIDHCRIMLSLLETSIEDRMSFVCFLVA